MFLFASWKHIFTLCKKLIDMMTYCPSWFNLTWVLEKYLVLLFVSVQYHLDGWMNEWCCGNNWILHNDTESRRVGALILATFITRGCSHQLFAGINRRCRANLWGDDHIMRLDIYTYLDQFWGWWRHKLHVTWEFVKEIIIYFSLLKTDH